MFAAIRKRIDNDDAGFTLIELMVVVLIIAILIAIAIPTFLGARTRAQDRAAQSDLRNAVVAAEVYYTDNESYAAASDAATVTALEAIEPEIDFVVSTTASVANPASIALTSTAAIITFVRVSASGTWYGVKKDTALGTSYCSSTVSQAALFTACTGTSW